MVNAQEWLNNRPEYNTVEKRNEVKELIIVSQEEKLEGKLDLSDFVNLEKLICSSNKLTELNLGKCSKLIFLDCYNNELTSLDLSQCNELEHFECDSN